MVEHSQKMFEADDGHLVEAMKLLALAEFKLGHFTKCEALCREIVETDRRLRGLDHYETLNWLRNLAKTRTFQGDYDEAIRLHEQVLDARRRTLGADHADTASAMTDLTYVLSRNGNHDAAAGLSSELLDARRRDLGPEHTKTLSAANELALVAHHGPPPATTSPGTHSRKASQNRSRYKFRPQHELANTSLA